MPRDTSEPEISPKHPDHIQRVFQAWRAQDPEAAKKEAAALRQAIADSDWDTVERLGGLDAVVGGIDLADEETAASASGGLVDNFRLWRLSSWRQMTAIRESLSNWADWPCFSYSLTGRPLAAVVASFQEERYGTQVFPCPHHLERRGCARVPLTSGGDGYAQ